MAKSDVTQLEGVELAVDSGEEAYILPRVTKVLIGRIVYPPYTPSQLRKVVDCYYLSRGGDGGLLYGDVMDTNGDVHKREPLHAYGDYLLLIEDHERKVNNHREKLKNAEEKFNDLDG